jgi:cell wall assembly regulator SMI1
MTPRIEQLIAEIEALGEVFTWYAPATEASIAALEQAFGVRLSPSYRAFLAHYGGGGIRAWKGISGIWNNDPLDLNLGTAYGDTVRMRAERGMPDHLIVVARGDEHFPPICLDTSRPGPDGEYPVVAFFLMSRTISTDSYTNFAEYLEEDLANSLEAIRETLPVDDSSGE